MLRHREAWWITIERAREHWVVQFECIWSIGWKKTVFWLQTEDGKTDSCDACEELERGREDWRWWRWWFCGLRKRQCQINHLQSASLSFSHSFTETETQPNWTEAALLTLSVLPSNLSTINLFFRHSKISAKLISQSYFIKMREIHCQFLCKGTVALHQFKSVKSAGAFPLPSSFAFSLVNLTKLPPTQIDVKVRQNDWFINSICLQNMPHFMTAVYSSKSSALMQLTNSFFVRALTPTWKVAIFSRGQIFAKKKHTAFCPFLIAHFDCKHWRNSAFACKIQKSWWCIWFNSFFKINDTKTMHNFHTSRIANCVTRLSRRLPISNEQSEYISI